MSELEIETALRQLVDATRRMSRDYCQAHELPVTTEEEMYAAMQRAEDVLDFLDELQ
jgi:hypothetical protein